MKKYLNLLLTVLMLAALTSTGQAESGPSGFPFLKIDTDNRSAAMGGTQLSVANSAMAAFTNPAVLSNTTGLNVATGLTNWIADIRHFGGAITYNAGSAGTFGFTGVWMDYGSFAQRYASEGSSGGFIDGGYMEGGSFSVAEYAVGLAYARPVTHNWQVGAHLKYAGQSMPAALSATSSSEDALRNRSRSGLLLDVGTVYYPGLHDLRFGAALKNLQNDANSADYGFNDLPAALSIGGAMDLLKLFSANNTNQLTFAFDWFQEPDY